MRNGLVPKSNSRKSFQPDRIYLFSDIKMKNILANQFSNYDYNYYKNKSQIFIKKYDILNYYSDFYKYALLQIDCRNLKDTLILNIDPNFKDGYFTYDNIYTNFIKIIDTNL